MLKNFGLGILLGLAAWVLGALDVKAQTQSLSSLLNEPSVSNLRVWEDQATKCKYIASVTSSGWYVIGAPRLRADGKPDCPDVDKK